MRFISFLRFKTKQNLYSCLVNYKTTILGVLTVISGISQAYHGNVDQGFTIIIGGVGLILSKDANKKPIQ